MPCANAHHGADQPRCEEEHGDTQEKGEVDEECQKSCEQGRPFHRILNS